MPLSDDTKRRIKEIYTTPGSPAAFSGVLRLYEECRRRNIDVTKKEVAEFLKGEKVYTLHVTRPQKHLRSRLISYTIDYSWESDLAVTPYYRSNKNFQYIMVTVDLLSEYIWAYPMKTKSADDSVKAFQQLMTDTGRKCSLFTTDAGTEFTNFKFQQLLKANDIYHHIAGGKHKASAAEYSIRLLKSIIFKYMTEYDTKRYLQVLPDMVEGLNKRKLKSLNGLSPAEVNVSNEVELFIFKYGRALLHQPEQSLHPGQLVRIRLKKAANFAKGYTPNFSTEIYTVVRASFAAPSFMYTVADQNGRHIDQRFYEEDLSPIHV